MTSTGPVIRTQQTLKQPVRLSGIGFFTSCDVELTFLPAAEDHGIQFQRTDILGSQPIPALIEHVDPQPRHTVIRKGEVVVEMIEHLMAALAGLQIDNCLIRLNGPEVPGFDGSSQPIVDALLTAGIQRQNLARNCLVIDRPLSVTATEGPGQIHAQPLPNYYLSYALDYGPGPILAQQYGTKITPETVQQELAPARTFVLEKEVHALQSLGIGIRHTAKDLLVFGNEGVIDNALRYQNECARHKVLDCLGDFALLGCDIIGEVTCSRSGHALNHAFIRKLSVYYSQALSETTKTTQLRAA